MAELTKPLSPCVGAMPTLMTSIIHETMFWHMRRTWWSWAGAAFAAGECNVPCMHVTGTMLPEAAQCFCRPGRDACTARCPCNMAANGLQVVDGCLVALQVDSPRCPFLPCMHTSGNGALSCAIHLQDPAGGGRVGCTVFECGPACACAPHCPARASQQGLRAAVVLQRDARCDTLQTRAHAF